MRHKEKSFPSWLRREVRREQDYLCALCGTSCKGHINEFEPVLEVHHKIPVFLGGPHLKENAVGLCPICHVACDHLTLDKDIPFEEILEEGVEKYIIPPKTA